MFRNRKFDTHAELVSSMAETVGVDLIEEIQRGNVAPEEARDRVYRCLSCTSPDLCRKFLDTHAETGAKHPPQYCRNRDELERMARG